MEVTIEKVVWTTATEVKPCHLKSSTTVYDYRPDPNQSLHRLTNTIHKLLMVTDCLRN